MTRHQIIFALALTGMLVPAPTALASAGQNSKDASATLSGGIETFRSGDNVVRTDKTEKGAVLCAWEIYVAVAAVGRECHEGQDDAFHTELDQSLARIDAFIIKNSKHPVTKAGLNARHAERLRQLRSSRTLCVGDVENMYEALRSRGCSALHAQTTDLLSIPREPVMNPCL